MNPQPSLVRALGPLVATAITVGTVIGSGIFAKPQSIAANIPFFGLVAIAWILGGILTLLGSLAYAECAVLFPKAGGNYVFLREGYGRLAGFLWGWVEFWIIRSASIAALATMFTKSFVAVAYQLAGPEAASTYLGYWSQRILTVVVILLLSQVNVRGVKWGGGLQLVITMVKVGSLLAILCIPFIFALSKPDTVDSARLAPAWPSFDAWKSQKEEKAAKAQADPKQEVTSAKETVPLTNTRFLLEMLGAFTTALLGILWAYHGWMNIAWVAEEVRDPQRNLPIALLGGVGIVIFLYLGANLSYSLVLTQDEMSRMKDPGTAAQVAPADASERAKMEEVSDRTVAIGFARRLLGPIGVALAAAAVMISVFGALNGNLMVGPRMLYAMSADGLAPQSLSTIHPSYNTPAFSIWVMGCWSSLLVLGTALLSQAGVLSAGVDHFDVLTNFAMFGAVIFETMAVVAIFVFRRKYPDRPRAYKCLGYPITPALYVILPALILGNMFVQEDQRFGAAVGVGFIIVGCVVYWLFASRSKQDRHAPR